jgi:hypothetical protein
MAFERRFSDVFVRYYYSINFLLVCKSLLQKLLHHLRANLVFKMTLKKNLFVFNIISIYA